MENSQETASPPAGLECPGRNWNTRKMNCPRLSAGDGRSDLSVVSLPDFWTEWEIIHKTKCVLCGFVFLGTYQCDLSAQGYLRIT